MHGISASLAAALAAAGATYGGPASTPTPLARVDAVMRVPGIGRLLLVRAATLPDGIVDNVYRIRRGRLERLHIEGPFGDGLVTALTGTAYVDLDCGAGARTIVQTIERPTPYGWRETLVTLVLRGRRLTVVHITKTKVARPRSRRCAVARR